MVNNAMRSSSAFFAAFMVSRLASRAGRRARNSLHSLPMCVLGSEAGIVRVALGLASVKVGLGLGCRDEHRVEFASRKHIEQKHGDASDMHAFQASNRMVRRRVHKHGREMAEMPPPPESGPWAQMS